jgi:hypothetical protein
MMSPRKLKAPFRFDIRKILGKTKRLPVDVDGVSSSPPFLGLKRKTNSVERVVEEGVGELKLSFIVS